MAGINYTKLKCFCSGPSPTPIAHVFVPATRERLAAGMLSADSPMIAEAMVDTCALSGALCGFHLPTCGGAKHVHYRFHKDETPDDHPANRCAYIGACACLKHVSVRTHFCPVSCAWLLEFTAHDDACLWLGKKRDGDAGIGTYERCSGALSFPSTIDVKGAS